MADNVFELRPCYVQEREVVAEELFAEFWAQWPKRVAKEGAKRAWRQLSRMEQQKAITTLSAHVKKWSEDDPRFIPHAATWLNGKRFNDELDGSIIYCKWAGCPRSGRFTRGSGIYCRIHYDALQRGESPNGR